MNGKQGGDPTKLAQALIAIAEMAQPPFRFIGGRPLAFGGELRIG